MVFNADALRANLSPDLGFSHEDRIEHARRMGWMCDRVVAAGGTVIADFICPTPKTRAAFGDAYTIWINRIAASRFEDTNRMFVAPERTDLRRRRRRDAAILGRARRWPACGPPFDPQKPDGTCSSARYQPFHEGHKRLIEEGLRRVGQVCIAVRDTHGLDEKIPCHSLL